MNLLEQMKHCRPHFDSPDGWYVLDYGSSWYIGLILNGFVQRTKKIGKVQLKGVNYFDRACLAVDERNSNSNYETDCHIPIVTN